MLNILVNIIWSITITLIIIVGINFTFKFNFIQFKFKKIFCSLFKKENRNGIKPITSLMMSLAGRIGVGSIAGVALSIYIGGIGSIFWLVIISFFSAPITFAESVLGIVYHKKDGSAYIGGPSYYLKYGLGKKKLAIIYSVLILISYVGGFLSIQTNTITKSITMISNIDPILISLIISLITSIIIFRGLNSITKITNKIVPVMTISYVLIALYIAIININIIPNIFLAIIKNAFNFKSFFSGFLPSLVIGIERGIFSSEAGLGTGSIASSITSSNDSINQGLIQIFGIYVTNIVICLSTAIIILTSNYNSLSLNDINGIEIALYSFNYHLGSIGNIILFIFIFLFSFSTILTGYYYGEASIKFIFKRINNLKITMLKVLTVFVVFIGGILSATLLWKVIDFLVGIFALINIYALFFLKDDVKLELICYNHKCDMYDK